MRVSISGQVMKCGRGVNRDSGREYTYLDIYDGDSLVRIYNYPIDNVSVGEVVEDVKVLLRSDAKIFASALK